MCFVCCDSRWAGTRNFGVPIQESFVTYFEREYKKTAPRNTASGTPLKLGSLPGTDESDTVVLR